MMEGGALHNLRFYTYGCDYSAKESSEKFVNELSLLSDKREHDTISATEPNLLFYVGYHHPILRTPCATIQFPLSLEDQQLIADMKFSITPDSLKASNACWNSAAGMAANQWGISKRIFILNKGDSFQAVLNPSYEPISDETVADLEGCFSVPLARGTVTRYVNIKAKYQNEKGENIEAQLNGWPARVFQHETDHLNGFTYDDKRAGKCSQSVFSD
eukprot:TRINITY_DN20968_c0_g1_i1.p1 TRINITY_DN20968_c0_g1~~TRINITY_DN20968_c0_g1_i1.p1  ORF type:complete len:216 (-),score=28.63 TRINITY_DN20968_c0_g1_i1:155-802(-)